MPVRIFYWRHVGERVECVVHKDAPDEGLGAAWGRGGRKEVGVCVGGVLRTSIRRGCG